MTRARADTGQTANDFSEPGLSFDSWRTPNSNRPALLSINADPDQGGTEDGSFALDVDEDGGTTADYSYTWNAPTNGGNSQFSGFVYIPPGGSYQMRNINDPDGANAFTVEEWVI